MNGSFAERVLGVFDTFFEGIIRFLPGLLAAVLILVVGVVLGLLVRFLLGRALQLARFDRLADASGMSQMLARADIASSPSAFVAALVFWFVTASFFMAGLSALGVDVINRLISEFFLYLPRIVSALIIIVAGTLLGNFLSRAALLAAVNAGVPSPRGISLVVRLLIGVLAFAMALEQLQIAKSIVLAAFIISFGAVMLGMAVAFGLGGRDVAKRILERQFEEREAGRREGDISHL